LIDVHGLNLFTVDCEASTIKTVRCSGRGVGSLRFGRQAAPARRPVQTSRKSAAACEGARRRLVLRCAFDALPRSRAESGETTTRCVGGRVVRRLRIGGLRVLQAASMSASPHGIVQCCTRSAGGAALPSRRRAGRRLLRCAAPRTPSGRPLDATNRAVDSMPSFVTASIATLRSSVRRRPQQSMARRRGRSARVFDCRRETQPGRARMRRCGDRSRRVLRLLRRPMRRAARRS